MGNLELDGDAENFTQFQMLARFPCSFDGFQMSNILVNSDGNQTPEDCNMNGTTTSNGLLPADVIDQVIRKIDSSTDELRGISLEVSLS